MEPVNVTPYARNLREAQDGVEAARMLLDAGVSAESRQKMSNDTPLHLALAGFRGAVSGRPVQIIKILIDAAADISLKNLDGNTVLHQIALHEEVLGSDFKGGIIRLGHG
jgi:ankyrin repeat protein